MKYITSSVYTFDALVRGNFLYVDKTEYIWQLIKPAMAMYFLSLNLMVQAEVCTNNGRIDMMVAAGDWIYVIEFKLNRSADEAMKQIEHKEYAMKYRKDGKRIMLIGVNFDFRAGNIAGWIKEEDPIETGDFSYETHASSFCTSFHCIRALRCRTHSQNCRCQ